MAAEDVQVEEADRPIITGTILTEGAADEMPTKLATPEEEVEEEACTPWVS